MGLWGGEGAGLCVHGYIACGLGDRFYSNCSCGGPLDKVTEQQLSLCIPSGRYSDADSHGDSDAESHADVEATSSGGSLRNGLGAK